MRINDQLYDMEAVADAASAEAGGDPPADTATLPETVPGEGTPSPEAAPPTPADTDDPYAGIDPEDLRSLAELAPVLRQALTPQPVAPQQTDQEGPPELDMFDPDSVRAYMQWERQQTIDAIRAEIAPVQQYTAEQQEQARDAMVKDALHDTEQRLGEFLGGDDSRSYALELAREILHTEMVPKYGMTNRAGELALEKAHSRVRAMEDAIGKTYHDRQVNQATTIAQAPAEAAATGAAVVTAAGGHKNEQAWLNAQIQSGRFAA